MTSNEWCRALGIAPPAIGAVAGHSAANTYALLIVALLERGGPMTLDEVAERFEAAGIAKHWRARLSLRRCKPGRPPVYREGDLYHLDPHDSRLRSWVFELGLHPPTEVLPGRTAPAPASLPGPDIALTASELDEAWKDACLTNWSMQRLVVAVLDAHGSPMAPAEAIQAVDRRTPRHLLRESAARFSRQGCAVEVLEDGRWGLAADADPALRSTRTAVRERIALARRNAALRPDPAETEKRLAEIDARRAAHGAELAKLRRALLVAFPPASPKTAALLDIAEHQIATFVGDELDELRSRLPAYDIIGAVDARGLLGALGFEPGARRLVELSPPRKSKQLNRRGRTLKITTALLVQGSCGISRPFGDKKKLAEYLAKGELTKLRRRLEADVKSLYALHEYGRLHGTLRLRWGFLDERIPAPWVDYDEPGLHCLMKSALANNIPLEVVVGSAPEIGRASCRERV